MVSTALAMFPSLPLMRSPVPVAKRVPLGVGAGAHIACASVSIGSAAAQPERHAVHDLSDISSFCRYEKAAANARGNDRGLDPGAERGVGRGTLAAQTRGSERDH